MDVEPKIRVVKPPEIIHLFIGLVFHEINHAILGVKNSIFGNTHIEDYTAQLYRDYN